MMHMTFYWGTKVTLLLDSWKTDSLLSYLLSLLACFLFSSFYQYLEDRRIKLKSASVSPPSTSSISTPLISFKRRVSSPKLASSLLFGLNSAIGYLLMLAIMSFNGGVFLAIVGGLSVGYFVFRSGDEERSFVDNPCACA